MTPLLEAIWQMLRAWLMSLLPPLVLLAVILVVLGVVGLGFYAMGIFNLFKRAVGLYLDGHDPKRRDRSGP